MCSLDTFELSRFHNHDTLPAAGSNVSGTQVTITVISHYKCPIFRLSVLIHALSFYLIFANSASAGGEGGNPEILV